MVFILHFVNMVFHIDWFLDIKEFLHPWDRSHSIVVYDPYSVLLDSVLLSIFASMFISDIGL